jgi:RNA polymerase sigma-70 factor (ECF subfamily)
LPATDQELLIATAAGDGVAFGELVGRHAQELFRLAQWLSRNRADAEDVLQETLAGAFKAARSFGGRSSVKTWLTGILIRQASKMRNRQRKFRQTISLDAPRGGDAPAAPASEPEAAVACTALSVDRRIDLAGIIETLPIEHREVIVLREMQGLSYEEIAAALDVPRGTVESRLHRARAGLKEKLNGYVTHG